ncbi:hypothetical protein MKW94_025328, partial [Papaver nudicaule]|nr:hypothetical protein [Papaver nudicaule]
IPIIFEGHLAQTAASHLKEKDLIHIAGHFSEEPPQFSLECGHCIGQVMVRQISFVKETPQARERYYSRLKKLHDTFWSDLCGNPSQWTDYRKDKLNGLVKPRHPDFKRKDSGQPLWLNAAPEWAISELPVISEGGIPFSFRCTSDNAIKFFQLGRNSLTEIFKFLRLQCFS